ncbi:bifunctional protein-disulfide isomerase/oxidoreductase DsbC [Psychromonas sp. Urea-02u-13]|uniref:bifunctional protein-disulfide isomerase/oxidoreductase DsbC n=1 Tax=Psychromonas sp. Urea-02u-13 TaxID=2058326 RepID=UPI000C33C4EF|nr:bifunctional protein-disulfide isomerase/oxidoreductase DsbC [Psychromonas sp. Urea-02u-13]PKG39221.1 bifunctional protein-disulfide isomerase/oxidoreductase DsbC [Psychromonas sp. Urea-02u-13]
MQLTFLKKQFIGALALVAFSSFSIAATADKATVENITKKLNTLEISVNSINPAVVDGLYEVLTNRGVYYVSKNAQFLVHGNVYDLDNKMENVTEKSLTVLRQNKLKAFEKDMIVYKAENEKHVITVFTDTSCGYCQKLHAEMADYNNLGITVRYLAFPRGGLNSNTYNTMVSIWCAEDPKLAMDQAKSRKQIDSTSCKNTVKAQYELGQFFGVTGTPALVLEDGSLQPGYLPADRLIKLLEQKKG